MAIVSEFPRVPLANPENFPLDALGNDLYRVVEEIQAKTKTPISAISAAVISAISFVCQGRIDVAKPGGGVMPPSLWFVVSMEQGEGKTRLCNEVFKSIFGFSEDRSAIDAGNAAVYQANLSAWVSVNKGINDRLRKKTAKGDDTQKEVEELRQNALTKPVLPKGIKLVFENVSPAQLLKSVVNQSPTVALVTSEGATVFNGRVFSDLGVINKSWDADGVSMVRADQDLSVSAFYLTILILSQEAILRDFLKTKGSQFINSGTASRMFIFKPISLVGGRYIDDDAGRYYYSYNTERFHRRCREILEDSFDKNNLFRNERRTLEFSPVAKSRWVSEFNKIESMMAEGGAYSSAKYIASRLPEKITRLSALLHYFEGGEGEISLGCLERSIAICSWFSNQTMIYLQPSGDTFQSCIDSEILENWFVAKYTLTGERSYCKTHLLKIGPNLLRSASRLCPAIEILVNRGKVTEYIPDGEKAVAIWLNDSYQWDARFRF